MRAPLSIVGLLLGTVFFAFSLTPSLLPRPFLVQGALSALSFAAGYGLGVAVAFLWTYLQLPLARARAVPVANAFTAVIGLVIAVGFLWQASYWQNSLRALMGMEESPGAHPVLIGLVAIVVAFVLIGLARLFHWVFRLLSRWLHRFLPPRISHLAGIFAAILLFWTVIDGVLVSSALRLADRSFQQLDALIEDDLPRPVRPQQTGSAASLVDWRDLGRQGRRFVAGGPTPEELSDLHRGDIATVAAQYSYLNSPLALLTQASYGADMARALFAEIYGYWRTLPRDTRPRLYLSGLSLGSLNSDLSFDLYDIIDDPFDGVLWSGPPFRHETWRRVTAERDPASPAWLPEFRGGSVVRFMNQELGLDRGHAEWGNFRIAFLQYASDPITFFSPGAAWREPDWMREPRTPDVSPELRWFPVVTMLQLAADMMVGTAPRGFGHEFAPAHYIDAWLALTEPEGWSEPELEQLRRLFE